MTELAKIEKFRISRDGTEMVVLVPKRDFCLLYTSDAADEEFAV